MQTELNLQPTNPVDLEIIARHDPRVKKRATIEVAIVRHLLDYLTEKGYHFNIDNGEEDVTTDDHDELVRQIFSVDQSHLYIRENDEEPYKVIFIVLGNDGWDLISDYSASIGHILDPYTDWLTDQQQ